MRLLLDTHVFLWLQSEPERLGRWLPVASDPSTELLLSAASSWELTIKASLGKLTLPEPVATWVPARARTSAIRMVGIDHAHVLAAAELPPLHRDPFDRLLIAQASALDAQLLTADAAVLQYDGPIAAIDAAP